MIDDRLRVFVSSKMAELAAERVAIKEVLDDLNVDAWVFEQDAGARPETIEESYKEQLEASDLYIGVFWKGYGEYTVDEFELAQATRTDCLIYQKQGAEAAGRDPRLQNFLDKIGKVETGLTVQFFDTPEQLRGMVKRDTARWQTRIVRKYRDGGAGANSLPADPNLVVLRNKVKQAWVDGVLGRVVAETGLVDLHRESRPDAVEYPLVSELVSPDQHRHVIGTDTRLTEIFEQLQRSLLILGEPGSGKTTTALQLVQDLIAKAERDESRPIPVVLNLSDWSAGSTTMITWVIKQLSKKYQVPARISRDWLKQDRLALILDGLDEVAAAHREGCISAINRFTENNAAASLVVTSQSDPYEALSVRLRLNGAIFLQPLESPQIDTYLEKAGEHLVAFRAAIKKDATLKELARSPLMLSVMCLAYRGRTTEQFEADASDTAETRRDELFDAYVDRAFQDRKSTWSYSREATTSWLSWLARRMSERSRTVFLIEDLQPGWLATRVQFAGYLTGLALLFGFVFGGLCILYRNNPSALPPVGDLEPPDVIENVAWILACATYLFGIGIVESRTLRSRVDTMRSNSLRILIKLVPYAAVFVLVWIPFALLMTQNFWLTEPWPSLWLMNQWPAASPDKFWVRGIVPAAVITVGVAAYGARQSLTRSIQTTERLGLQWNAMSRGALYGFVAGVSLGVLIYAVTASGMAPVYFWSLIGVAFGAVLGGFQPRLVRGKTVPNQGIRLSLSTSLRAAALAVPVAVIVPLAAYAAGGDYRDPVLILIWFFVALAFLAICLAAWFGALDFGKHYLVRAVIGVTRQGPWDFRRFLNEASKRNLTQRVGGGYMFVHQPLLKHFAAMDLPPPLAEEVHDSERDRRGSSAKLIIVMVALALVGAVTLFTGLEQDAEWAVVAGGILLGIGAQWLVIRSAVSGAISAGQRDDEDE